MTPEPLLAPFTDKGKEVSNLFLSVCSGTENQNRKSTPGPTWIGPVTGSNSTGYTVSGHLRVYARRAATSAWLTRLYAWL